MTKAILLLDSNGVAIAPATLCAEAVTEAQKLKIPLFDQRGEFMATDCAEAKKDWDSPTL